MIIDTPTGNRITGFYRGRVLKHCNDGKCKIFIPGVFPDKWNKVEECENLPDAEQASGIGFDNNNGNGFFTYPAIDSIVWCFFANEDQNLPVYFATCQGGGAASGIYNNNMIQTDVTSNIIIFGNLQIEFNKGEENSQPFLNITNTYSNGNSSIIISNDGTIKLNSCSDIELNSAGSIKLNSNKSIIATSGTNTNITSKTDDIVIESSNGNIKLQASANNGVVQLRSFLNRLQQLF